MRLAAIVLACTACGGGAKPAPAPAPATPLDSPVTPRSTPPPKLTWTDRGFDVAGLPAVARAGEIAVVPVRDNDSARGFPNLRIDVRDRTDKVAQTIQVMTANEYEQLVPDGHRATPELVQRLEVANHELAKLHGLHDLVVMHAMEIQPTKDVPHLAIDDTIDVEFDSDHLHVFHHDDSRPFITLATTGWLAVAAKRCPDCPPCENPALLGGVYHAPLISLVVLDIAYKGTDTCWQPPDQWHVVAW
jgi:hypothetical protein